jgi:hypothetical protein
MSKPMSPVVCGITGKTLTEWRERTFVQRYINGSLQTIPLYLDINEVIALHKQSETYLAKQEAKTAEGTSDAEEVSEPTVTESTEVLEGTAAY